MLLSFLAKELGFAIGDADCRVSSLADLRSATNADVTFIDNASHVEDLKITQAGAVILKEELLQHLPNGSIALVSKNPYLDMAKMSKYFAKKPFVHSGTKELSDLADIDVTAIIGDNCVIEEGVHIMPGVVIGANVKIGKNSKIYPNVVIYDDTIIGENCFIFPGACIGSDGYGYAHTNDGQHIKIYHSGYVHIEDNVEIGANTTIDRAVFGVTRLKAGCKIDNLVQIGHNCELGESCLIVSQSGLSGSTKLGRNVVMGGQSAAAGHLEIGDFAMIAGRGGVSKSIKGGETYGGFPLMKQKDWLKMQAKIIHYFRKKI